MGMTSRTGALASELFKGETKALPNARTFVPCGWLRNNTLEHRSKRKVICFLLRGVSLSGQVVPFVIVSFRKGRNTLPPSPWAQKKLISVCFSLKSRCSSLVFGPLHSSSQVLGSLYHPPAGGGSRSDGTSDSSAINIT